MACPSIAFSTRPTLIRFIYYKLLTLVPVSAAITAMFRQSDSLIWPILYVAACLTHAGIMNHAKCPHCPYYKMGARTFSCFIWWGTPKLWADREGPEPTWVGKYATFGMAVAGGRSLPPGARAAGGVCCECSEGADNMSVGTVAGKSGGDATGWPSAPFRPTTRLGD